MWEILSRPWPFWVPLGHRPKEFPAKTGVNLQIFDRLAIPVTMGPLLPRGPVVTGMANTVGSTRLDVVLPVYHQLTNLR